MSSLSICCLLMLVVIVPIVTSTTVPPQYETKSYSRQVLQYTQVCRRCGWWWWRRMCCYVQAALVKRQFTYRVCKPEYTETDCNIPVCSPPCENEGVCVAVNKCDCPWGYSGSQCQTVGASGK